MDAGTIRGSQPIDMFAYEHKKYENSDVQLTPMMMTLILLLLQLLLLLSTKHQPHCCDVLDRVPHSGLGLSHGRGQLGDRNPVRGFGVRIRPKK